jgi:hypothetical protein
MDLTAASFAGSDVRAISAAARGVSAETRSRHGRKIGFRAGYS